LSTFISSIVLSPSVLCEWFEFLRKRGDWASSNSVWCEYKDGRLLSSSVLAFFFDLSFRTESTVRYESVLSAVYDPPPQHLRRSLNFPPYFPPRACNFQRISSFLVKERFLPVIPLFESLYFLAFSFFVLDPHFSPPLPPSTLLPPFLFLFGKEMTPLRESFHPHRVPIKRRWPIKGPRFPYSCSCLSVRLSPFFLTGRP